MQWQKSPQYQGMPHNEYMQTEEGKRAQQAFNNFDNWASTQGRTNSAAPAGAPAPGQGGIPQDATFRTASQPTKAPDMSAYATGKAQPMQQSYGTPYGQPPSGSYQYGDGAARNSDGQPVWYSAAPATTPPAAPANPYANMAPGVYYGGQQIPGNQQQALQTAMAQRDAMAVLVNNNNMQYSLANAFGQDLGRPQFDYGSAMQQAQNMVQNGFYNPFTQYYNQTTDPLSQLGNYAPPTAYNPQQPFPPIGGFGVQQPQAPQRPEYSPTRVQGSEWDQVEQAWRLPAKPQQQTPPMSGLPTQPSGGPMPETKGGMSGPGGYQMSAPSTPPPGSSPRDWRLTGSGWENNEGTIWTGRGLPWESQPQPSAPQEPRPRTSPTTPTSGNWIQRPDGQWEETQPKMYGGMDPVLMAPKEAAEDERRYLQYKQGTAPADSAAKPGDAVWWPIRSVQAIQQAFSRSGPSNAGSHKGREEAAGQRATGARFGASAESVGHQPAVRQLRRDRVEPTAGSVDIRPLI